MTAPIPAPPDFTTALGTSRVGTSPEALAEIRSGSVDLICTSPPFSLVRKKRYGNADAPDYVAWISPILREMHRVLGRTGSLVLEIGPSWNKGSATQSLVPYEVLIEAVRVHGFHLAQACLHHNPSALPVPAEWVTVRRLRLKEATRPVWWLSKSSDPRADNRRVLVPYSTSMEKLLREGYTPGLRPSGHDVSKHFDRRHAGAIPSNLLSIANTNSSDPWFKKVRAAGLPVHPARFPMAFAAFWIRLCTVEGDLVLDPFAGSCTTGAAAEGLGRRWIAIEREPAYVASGRPRFGP